jgi:hypothetical protein
VRRQLDPQLHPRALYCQLPIAVAIAFATTTAGRRMDGRATRGRAHGLAHSATRRSMNRTASKISMHVAAAADAAAAYAAPAVRAHLECSVRRSRSCAAASA